MKPDIRGMLLARAKLDERLNAILTLLAVPADAPLADSSSNRAIASACVASNMDAACRALREFEEAARGA